MYHFIQKLKLKDPNAYAYCVPIKDIVAEFPILGRIWTEYKGMVNYGTDFKEQPKLLNQSIKNNNILNEFKNEVMNYPVDKKKYDDWELYGLYKNKHYKPLVYDYNKVWHFRNGKFQHLINDVSFPNYYWDEKSMKELEDIGCDARGNFYYPPGGFREWHTNRINKPGYRIYFIACTENGKSYFNYIIPKTNKVVNVPDKNEYANIFAVTDSVEKALWHSIYSDTHRFSLGFNITEV